MFYKSMKYAFENNKEYKTKEVDIYTKCSRQNETLPIWFNFVKTKKIVLYAHNIDMSTLNGWDLGL